MAVVASLQFGHLPTGGTSFSGKRLEERSRRVAFCNAGAICSVMAHAQVYISRWLESVCVPPKLVLKII